MNLVRADITLAGIAGISRLNARRDNLSDTSIDRLVPMLVATRGWFEPVVLVNDVDPQGLSLAVEAVKNHPSWPPLIRPAGDASLMVLAGRRRFLAMQRAVARGLLPGDTILPVHLFTGSEAQARELSLAENYAHEPMTPVEEVIAFRDCAAAGLNNAEIARDFGVDERHVRGRLALAGLAPKIIEAWRDGSIDQRSAEAFCVTPDPAEQEALFTSAPNVRRNPAEIRRRLRGEAVRADSGLARFVGQEAYLKAGGRIDEDLFGDEAWWLDAGKATSLAEARLHQRGEALQKAEGWSWFKTQFDDGARDCTEAPEAEADYTDGEETRLDEIDAAARALWHEDPSPDDAAARAAALDSERQSIEGKAWSRGMPAARRRKLGLVIRLDYTGGIDVSRAQETKAQRDTRREKEERKSSSDSANRIEGPQARPGAAPDGATLHGADAPGEQEPPFDFATECARDVFIIADLALFAGGVEACVGWLDLRDFLQGQYRVELDEFDDEWEWTIDRKPHRLMIESDDEVVTITRLAPAAVSTICRAFAVETAPASDAAPAPEAAISDTASEPLAILTAQLATLTEAIDRFLKSRTVAGAKHSVSASALHDAYNAWSVETGGDTIDKQAFTQQLLSRGIVKKRKEAGTFWLGLALADELPVWAKSAETVASEAADVG